MPDLPPVERFVASTGVRIYRIPCEVFPGFVAYVYLLLEAGPPTLIDTGSGFGDSSEQILAGIHAVQADHGESVDVTDIKRIILTHGHIDHFGGLPHILERTRAQVGIHALDRRVITAHEERVIVATKALRIFLQEAGVKPDLQTTLMDMYGFSKKNVRSVHVDFTLADGENLDGLRIIHTPGHCPGQVCIMLGDILLSSDHILEKTTPHQAPESITAYTGLGHYLESLEKVRQVPGFDLALGGHEKPILDVYKRIDTIHKSHLHKLDKLCDIIREAVSPITISNMTGQMYPHVTGFHVLLALLEVGAHVENLYQTGYLAVVNLDELETQDYPALRYRPA